MILRIDSPGGDAVASDEMLREVRLLSKKKPTVISFSDYCGVGRLLHLDDGRPDRFVSEYHHGIRRSDLRESESSRTYTTRSGSTKKFWYAARMLRSIATTRP